MNLAIDIYYKENQATCIGVLFEWDDKEPRKVIKAYLKDVAEYVSGQFYKRELPCVMAVVYQVKQYKIDCIIVDGHVQLGEGEKGLGEYVYEAVEKQYPVIGIAKKSYFNNRDYVQEVRRGESESPLYVSAIGTDLEEAALWVKEMHGDFRFPSILKELDRLTRE
ncbi:MAG: endonuclease V [Bacteroidetes bacterium]|nr:MAG: endonuclease V [Bacteroidota bacterium]